MSVGVVEDVESLYHNNDRYRYDRSCIACRYLSFDDFVVLLFVVVVIVDVAVVVELWCIVQRCGCDVFALHLKGKRMENYC